MSLNLLIAGFGGQGVLFMGKAAAYTAMIEDKFVSWLPSYGPEMRGGTANCSVCIDDREISCPLVTEPETLVVLNQPSYDKFISSVRAGGQVFLDSSLIRRDEAAEAACREKGVSFVEIPCTAMAEEAGLTGLANIVMLGQVLKVTGFTTLELQQQAIGQCVPASRRHLLEGNLKALAMGYEYRS